ncbi:MAG: hypothetical protein EHM41_00185 [Chloroflexi bacterium]|nr:MAG: hypothetical protein EHM41_00185 [Chloroflexota bacterium]
MQTNHFTVYLSIERRAVVLCNKGRSIARFTNPDEVERLCSEMLKYAKEVRENANGKKLE